MNSFAMRMNRPCESIVAWTILMAVALMLLPWLSATAQTAPVDGLPPIPALQQRVTDQTGTLDSTQRDALERTLTALETDKGAQLAVLLVDTTGDEPIEQYAVRAFDTWRLGREKVDDGVLLLIAKSDRKLRIEVGYGLEGAVPDVIASRIIREQITPHFKKADFAAGVLAGVTALDKQIRGEALPPPAPSTRSSGVSQAVWGLFSSVSVEYLIFGAVLLIALPPWLAAIIGAVIGYLLVPNLFVGALGAGLGFLGSIIRAALPNLPASTTASRHGSTIGTSSGGWSSGSSSSRSSGSSSGGFSGGGGRSGGGGASGSW